MADNTKLKKLHLGCGNQIKKGWINHDIVALPNVDVVHNLKEFPWPFDDGQFEEVYMKDVLEHLPDTIKTMEELYRITAKGAKVYITVPYWNSYTAVGDPTHIKFFNEFSFDFFDPNNWQCKERHYYSTARFYIKKIGLGITPFEPIIKIPKLTRDYVIFNPIIKKVVLGFASFFSNVVHTLELYLERA